MVQYQVTGMSCAACSSRVEKAVIKVPGVTSCTVNLLTNSMGVEGTASENDVIQAVVDAGYGASVAGQKEEKDSSSSVKQQTDSIYKRLYASIGFLLVLMYFSMGHMMWGFPIPKWFEGNHVAMGLVQLLLAGIVMVINQKFFINGFKGLINHAPNMDTLVALGSMASFVWSVIALFFMTDAQLHGDSDQVMKYMHEFYFESAAMILTLITVGKLLEARSKGKTTDALKALMNLAPKMAHVIRDGQEMEISVEQVRKGDVFLVKPGESIPVDGIVLEGASAVNEAALTGESIPVDKTKGDLVQAATLNQSGVLRCEATRVGKDTTLSQIIQMVQDAAATKAPIAKIADQVSGVFVPVVIGIAVVTMIIWLLIGQEFSFALARGISVLVISCPCALGLATPVAIMVGNGQGARHGILFKTAVSLEETGKVKCVALDKTGTITNGTPVVTDIVAQDNKLDELLQTAYMLEVHSEHPLACAIVKESKQRGVVLGNADDFRALPGNGVKAVSQGVEITGGSVRYIDGLVHLPKDVKVKANTFSKQGKTPLLFAKDEDYLGMIVVADTIRDDSREAIRQLHDMGIRVVMLTGDNQGTAEAIGKEAGVDEVIAEVLPDGKEAVIRKLKESGKVAMVGDGINDAPALTRADMGIAIGAGADVAVDAADVVLMKNSLMDVPTAIRLSRATLKNIKENLFWAFIYNMIGIPVAAGAFVHFGLTLNPMLGAAAMSLSSFCVVTNALRLNLFQPYKSTKEKVKGEKIMKKTMKIEGMMCGHCEARVKKVLEGIEGVESAEVSHEKDEAIVTMTVEVADEVLKKVVEDQDYTVISIQ